MRSLSKKLFTSLFSSSLLLTTISVSADEVSTATKGIGFIVTNDPTKLRSGGFSPLNLYKVNESGSTTLLHEDIFPNGNSNAISSDDITVDSQNGKIYIQDPTTIGAAGTSTSKVYDVETNTFSTITVTGLPDGADPKYISIPAKLNEVANKKCSTSSTECSDNDTKFVSIGGDNTEELIRVAEDGISTGGSTGKSIIKYVGDELHIGENSWITKEEGGRQKVYAKDAAGNPIPIDYTNGTKLLINGRDVEQSINNVGALSAALTGLPTVPTDTTLACGLGTGTHGGDFAFSGGCASKVNDKLSINYAASMTMPGQDYAGDFEDTFSARAGFVWKLGKSTKPTLISLKAKEKMENKINSLEEKNEKILSKNQKLENKVSTLLARLDRLEKVALSESQSKDLATIKLP